MRGVTLQLAAVFLLAAVSGCATERVAPPAAPPFSWSDDMQTIAEANNRFAFDLYGKLREEKGNLFFSPYSAHTALTMTSTGAMGTTRDQMVKVLRLPADEQKSHASGDLAKYFTHPRPDFELSVANAIWGQTGYPWRPEFLAIQKDRFGAGFQEADFIADPEAQRLRINAWAEEQTRGKIKDLIREGLITRDQRMVLANAIYFKGAWQDQFDPSKTHPQSFTLADGTQIQVPTMCREGGFRMYSEFKKGGSETPEFQLAEIPYRGGELSMVVLLPGTHLGLPALEAKLSAEALAGWLAAAYDAKESMICLPKFRIETEAMMLDKPLKKLGMVDAFDPELANFRGLHTSPEQLFVNFVVQKAFVDVNEEGTEAAAATAVGIILSSAPLDFTANRPFLFLVRDTRHGTILFLGRVQKP